AGRRRILVAGEDAVNVVRPVGPRLDDQRLVGRERAVERGARRLLVRERRDELVGRATRPLKHLARVVGTVGHLLGRGKRLDLRFAITDAAARPVGAEVAVMQQVHRMAARADLLVDLEAALRCGAVEGAERPGEGPAYLGRRHLLLGIGAKAGERQAGDRKGEASEAAHHGFSIGREPAGAMRPPPLAVTASLMLVGSGSGRSTLPSTHIRKKWKK